MSVFKKAQIGSLVALKTLAAQRKCFVRVAISNYCGARLAWLWKTINSFEPLFPNFVGRLELFTTTGMRKHNFIKLFKKYKQQDTETIAHFPLTVTIEIRGEGENDDLNLRMDVFWQTQVWKKTTANTKRQLDTTAYFPLSVNIEIRGELLCLLLLCGRNLELLVVHEEFHSVRKAMLRLLAPSLAHTNSLFRVYASTGM